MRLVSKTIAACLFVWAASVQFVSAQTVTRSSLTNTINSAITSNGRGAITGQSLNAILQSLNNNSGVLGSQNAVFDWGWVGDGQTGTATVFGGQLGVATTGIAPAFGQFIGIPGLGPNGGPFQADIQPNGTLSVLPTFGSNTVFARGEVCHVANAGTGYTPGDLLTVVGGTANAPTQCLVMETGVENATAVSGSAGSGATATQCQVYGTTGTTKGPRFSALFNIAGGGLGTLVSVTYDSQYTANPTNLSNEPVTSNKTGCSSLTGAAVSLQMGVSLSFVYHPGNYVLGSIPTSPESTTGGTGTGATYDIPSTPYPLTGPMYTYYTQANQAWWGTDNTKAMANTFSGSPTQQIFVPAGTYMLKCPTIPAEFTAQNPISLKGVHGHSVIQLSPWCVMPAGNIFVWGSQSGFAIEDVTFDNNDHQFQGLLSLPLAIPVGVTVSINGPGQDVVVKGDRFINTRAGQTGLQGFWMVTESFDRAIITGNECENTTNTGPLGHCINIVQAIPVGATSPWISTLTNFKVDDNFSYGGNIVTQITNGEVCNNNVGYTGYGAPINPGPGPLKGSTHITFCNNKGHDANPLTERGDADVPAGSEAYVTNSIFSGNNFWNNPGSGLQVCGQNNIISTTIANDNNAIWVARGGGVDPTNYNYEAGIVLLNTTSCNSNNNLVNTNLSYDSYALALATGQPTTGLTPKQQFGYADSNPSNTDYGKIAATNNLGFNVLGDVFQNASTVIADLLSTSQAIVRQPLSWNEGPLAAGATLVAIGPLSTQTGNTLGLVAAHPGTFHNLGITVVTAAVGAPIVETLTIGNSASNMANTTFTCSILVGQTTCSFDTIAGQVVTPGQFYSIKVVNGSSSSTGQMVLVAEYDQTQ